MREERKSRKRREDQVSWLILAHNRLTKQWESYEYFADLLDHPAPPSIFPVSSPSPSTFLVLLISREQQRVDKAVGIARVSCSSILSLLYALLTLFLL
jgi:hypothetical protein